MTKTKEELDQLKIDYETITNKLKELTEDELGYVIGGLATGPSIYGMTDTIKDTRLVDEGNIDWKSSEELPAEPGKYKLK